MRRLVADDMFDRACIALEEREQLHRQHRIG